MVQAGFAEGWSGMMRPGEVSRPELLDEAARDVLCGRYLARGSAYSSLVFLFWLASVDS